MTPEQVIVEAENAIVALLEGSADGWVTSPSDVMRALLAERHALLVALGGRPVARGSSFSDTWHGCHDEDREAWVVPDE